MTAVETFQQLKTTFTLFEKLEVLVETFKEINEIGQEAGGSDFCWCMDNLFPVLVSSVKVNSVQEACATYFAVHVLKFEILQTT